MKQIVFIAKPVSVNYELMELTKSNIHLCVVTQGLVSLVAIVLVRVEGCELSSCHVGGT